METCSCNVIVVSLYSTMWFGLLWLSYTVLVYYIDKYVIKEKRVEARAGVGQAAPDGMPPVVEGFLRMGMQMIGSNFFNGSAAGSRAAADRPSARHPRVQVQHRESPPRVEESRDGDPPPGSSPPDMRLPASLSTSVASPPSPSTPPLTASGASPPAAPPEAKGPTLVFSAAEDELIEPID